MPIFTPNSNIIPNSSITSTGTIIDGNVIWTIWNQSYTGATTTSISSTDIAGTSNQVWTIWCQDSITGTTSNVTGTAITGATATVISNNSTWTIWNEHYTQIALANEAQVERIAARGRVSEAEVQARMLREQQYREEQEKAALERKLANEKAEVLLLRHLTPQQKEELQQKGAFTVIVDGETYRIRRGRAGNIDLLGDEAKVRRTFCVHPTLNCPDADTMLAQKLLLETNKRQFYELANITEKEGSYRNFRAPRGIELLESMAANMQPGQA